MLPTAQIPRRFTGERSSGSTQQNVTNSVTLFWTQATLVSKFAAMFSERSYYTIPAVTRWMANENNPQNM
jgi:hypothetical protein